MESNKMHNTIFSKTRMAKIEAVGRLAL